MMKVLDIYRCCLLSFWSLYVTYEYFNSSKPGNRSSIVSLLKQAFLLCVFITRYLISLGCNRLKKNNRKWKTAVNRRYQKRRENKICGLYMKKCMFQSHVLHMLITLFVRLWSQPNFVKDQASCIYKNYRTGEWLKKWCWIVLHGLHITLVQIDHANT